jgi:hypothetical protein
LLPAAKVWSLLTILITAAGLLLVPALVPPSLASSTQALTVLIVVASSMHVASSSWFLTEEDTRAIARSSRFRYVVAPLAAICLSVVAALFVSPEVMNVMLVGFVESHPALA